MGVSKPNYTQMLALDFCLSLEYRYMPLTQLNWLHTEQFTTSGFFTVYCVR
jgi:ligand-binding SRPBCC domain-containing protein